jgi:hypothetical protein
MLIEDWRPKMFCKDIVPKPVHKRTGFLLEEGHKYYHEDDAQDNTVLPLKIKYAFRSPTGLIKDFHEEFDTIPEAKKYVIRHKLHYVEQLVFCLGHAWGYGFFEGTTLHGYGESLFNKWECRRLTWPRHALWRIYTKS